MCHIKILLYKQLYDKKMASLKLIVFCHVLNIIGFCIERKLINFRFWCLCVSEPTNRYVKSQKEVKWSNHGPNIYKDTKP